MIWPLSNCSFPLPRLIPRGSFPDNFIWENINHNCSTISPSCSHSLSQFCQKNNFSRYEYHGDRPSPRRPSSPPHVPVPPPAAPQGRPPRRSRCPPRCHRRRPGSNASPPGPRLLDRPRSPPGGRRISASKSSADFEKMGEHNKKRYQE